MKLETLPQDNQIPKIQEDFLKEYKSNDFKGLFGAEIWGFL